MKSREDFKEQRISFDIAKLAKSKGFNKFYNAEYYDSQGKEWWGFSSNLADYEDKCVKCSQGMLQKWLREEHEIFVSVSGHTDVWKFDIITLHPHLRVPVNLANFDVEFKRKYYDDFVTYKSYEDALEVGLQEGLLRTK